MNKNIWMVGALLAACGLSACGGSDDGGSNRVESVAFLSKLQSAKGFVITGDVAPQATRKNECLDENGDPGTLLTIAGESVCQAELQSNRIYSVTEKATFVRVQYLDQDGNEVAGENIQPLRLVDLGQGFVLTQFVSPGFNRSEFFLARKSDGAVFSLSGGPANNFDSEADKLGLTWLQPLQVRSGDILISQDFNSGPDVSDESRSIAGLGNRTFNLDSGSNDDTPLRLLRASRNEQSGADLQSTAVSPASHNVEKFLAEAGNGLVVYQIESQFGGDDIRSNERFVALNPVSGAFSNVAENLIGENTFATMMQGLDGGLYFFAASETFESRFNEASNENEFRKRCQARLWELTFSNLQASAELVATAQTNEGFAADDNPDFSTSRYCGDAQSRRSGTAFDQRWVSVVEGAVLEIDFGAATPTMRYVNRPALGTPLRPRDQFSGLEIPRVVASDNFLYAVTEVVQQGQAQQRVRRLDVANNYALATLELANLQIDGLEPLAGDSVVVRATDQSNGDSLVLVVEGTSVARELSRNADVEFVSFERVN